MSFVPRAGRADLEIPVELEFDRATVRGITGNIGLGGVFVAAESHAIVGERAVVRLTLPGRDEAILAKAEVRWVRREPAPNVGRGACGMGLRFMRLSLAGAAAIDQIMRERALVD